MLFFAQVLALQHCCSYKPCLPELCIQEEEQVCADSWALSHKLECRGKMKVVLVLRQQHIVVREIIA